MVHIAFLIPTLGVGGAQRVATLLSNQWAKDGHAVDLISFENAGDEPFYELKGVSIHYLGVVDGSSDLVRSIKRNLTRVTRLRSLLLRLQPDNLVAFMTDANVIALLGSCGLDIPVIVSERNQPERPGLGLLHRSARRVSYRWSNAIVMQTETMAAWARARFSPPVHVIPNPVILDSTVAPSSAGQLSRPTIVAAGRLVEQKGFDVLVNSFIAVAGNHPEWDLIIYGEGPLRDSLWRRVIASGLEPRIALPGLTTDIGAALRRASLFVVPSRYEGYPNVLIEALACGLPVVATDCAGGTAEIVEGGFYARLVPPDDPNALAEALDGLMSNSQLRAEYATRAPLAVTNLDVSLICSRWLELMDSLTQQTSAQKHARIGKTVRT
jgi:glycosyltransferase involved in cell wall biosynthesis